MISLSDWKALLQISSADYDTIFDLYEPIVSDDVEDITGRHFDQDYTFTTSSGSSILTGTQDLYESDLFAGAGISGTGIPSNAQVYDWSAYTVSMDKKATGSGSASITINPLPSRLKPIVAKMVLFQITNETTNANNPGKEDVKSKNLLGMSVSFESGKKLDKKYNYPVNLVETLRRFAGPKIDIGRSRLSYSQSSTREGL